jgi:TP901 family phage tail tape measure protein
VAGKFSVEGIFKMTDRMTRPIAKMESRFERMQRTVRSGASGLARAWNGVGSGISKALDRARGPLESLHNGMAAVGGAALVVGAATAAGLTKVMSTGMDFEKALLSAGNKFEAGISKNSDTFKQLSAVARKVGGSTEFSATQAANGLKELAGAGLDAQQAMAALPGTVNLATAAEMEDMAAATEIAVKSLGAFGLKAKDPLELANNLQRVSDVLVKTEGISSTSVPAFFEAIAEGGAVAKTAGASIETYGALVAGLSDIEQGSKAGTTLKNMFLTLSKPTNEAAEALNKFGIKTIDSLGNTRDAIDVLRELKTATSKLGTGDRAGVLEQIFGKIPLAGVMTLMDKIDEVGANRDKLVNQAGGSVDKKAASMRSGGTGAWDNFTSGLEEVSLSIFEVVGEPLNSLLTKTTEWIAQVKDGAIPFVKQLTTSLADGFNAAWPAVKGALDMIGGLGGQKQALNTVRTLAEYLGKVVAVAIGAAAIFIKLAGLIAGLVAVQVRILTATWNGLIAAIGAVAFAVSDTIANIRAKWEAFDFGEMASQLIDGLVNGIEDGAQWVIDAVANLGNSAIDALKDTLGIQSPSKEFAKLGVMTATGFGNGFDAEMAGISTTIGRSITVPAMPAINALSLGSDAPPAPLVTPTLESREDRMAAALDGDLGTGEIVIRDETGNAEVTEQPKRTRLTIEPARHGVD